MPRLEQAILSLQPEAQFTVVGDQYSGITWLTPNIPQPTEEQVNVELINLQAKEAQAEQAAKDAKASALAKLAALGLTEDEIKALLG
jgi:hypothetical protein